MGRQQQMHMKEVYADSALRPLASNLDNESISNSSFKNAYTQDTPEQRINEMLTRASKAKAGTEYFDMASQASGDGPVGISNYIHAEDHRASIASMTNDHSLTQLEHEKQQQEQTHNYTRMLT